MTFGLRDSTSVSINHLTEDEIFCTPIVNPPWGGEDFGDSAGNHPLIAGVQWKDREAEIFETFLSDLNSAYGVDVHAEAVRQSMEPAYVQRSSEMWPNGGLDQAVTEQLAALSRNVRTPEPCITFRHSMNCFPQRRRPEECCLPDATPVATWEAGERWRSRGDIPEARTFEHPIKLPNTNPTMIIEDFPSVLRHPFDVSILPVMYALNRAQEPLAPIPVHYQPFSTPDVDSPAVTVTWPIHPVQEQDLSMAVDLQYQPPMSMDSECQLNFNHPIRSTTTRTNYHAQYGPVMNANLECQLDFNNPSSTTIMTNNPAQEPVSMMEDYGPALSSDLDRQIRVNYSSPSSECSIQEINLWGPLDTINLTGLFPEPVPKPAAQELNVDSVKNPRLTWTSELIQKFEVAVGSLGGPHKATPKAILRAMDCPGVNILHVKSRLQKFRLQTDHSSRIVKRQHLSTNSEQIPCNPEETFESEKDMQEKLNETLEKCKDWTQQLTEQNLQMSRLLALQHAQSEAALQNAANLQAFAAKSRCIDVNNPQL